MKFTVGPEDLDDPLVKGAVQYLVDQRDRLAEKLIERGELPSGHIFKNKNLETIADMLNEISKKEANVHLTLLLLPAFEKLIEVDRELSNG